jgi:hypothetical protein
MLRLGRSLALPTQILPKFKKAVERCCVPLLACPALRNEDNDFFSPSPQPSKHWLKEKRPPAAFPRDRNFENTLLGKPAGALAETAD